MNKWGWQGMRRLVFGAGISKPETSHFTWLVLKGVRILKTCSLHSPPPRSCPKDCACEVRCRPHPSIADWHVELSNSMEDSYDSLRQQEVSGNFLLVFEWGLRISCRNTQTALKSKLELRILPGKGRSSRNFARCDVVHVQALADTAVHLLNWNTSRCH